VRDYICYSIINLSIIKAVSIIVRLDFRSRRFIELSLGKSLSEIECNQEWSFVATVLPFRYVLEQG
jgi:hypothetical protein